MIEKVQGIYNYEAFILFIGCSNGDGIISFCRRL